MSIEQLHDVFSRSGHNWSYDMPPVAEAEIQAALATVHPQPTPADLVAAYKYGDGLTVGPLSPRVRVYSLRDLQDANANPAIRQQFPSALFLATFAGGILFVDVDGSLGQETGAVFACQWGLNEITDIRRCTSCISELFDLVVRGFYPWRDESAWPQFMPLSDEERVARMNALLTGKPLEELNSPALDRLAVLSQVRQPVPADLRAFYERTDGMGYIATEEQPYLGYLEVLTISDLLGFDTDTAYTAHNELHSALIFARTNGGEVLYIDVDGSMGHGAGAVYFDSLSSMDAWSSLRCAASVVQALEVLEQGYKPWNVEYKGRYVDLDEDDYEKGTEYVNAADPA